MRSMQERGGVRGGGSVDFKVLMYTETTIKLSYYIIIKLEDDSKRNW